MKDDVENPELRLFDRLWFKSAMLFCGVFLLTFFAGWFYDAVSAFGAERPAGPQSVQSPAPLDANIEKDLESVVAADLTPERTEIKDPFTDRSNLSELPVATAPASTNSNVSVSAPAARGGVSQSVSSVERQPTESVPIVDPGSAEATLARLRAREEKILAGREGGPESMVFAVSDLQPVGIVSGGNGEPEVMFYTTALDKVMSFPLGAKFFDGWLIGLRPDGVEFGSYGSNAVRFKSWSSGS